MSPAHSSNSSRFLSSVCDTLPSQCILRDGASCSSELLYAREERHKHLGGRGGRVGEKPASILAGATGGQMPRDTQRPSQTLQHPPAKGCGHIRLTPLLSLDILYRFQGQHRHRQRCAFSLSYCCSCLSRKLLSALHSTSTVQSIVQSRV